MLQNGGSDFLPNRTGPLIGLGQSGTLQANGRTWFASCFEGDVRKDGKATLAIIPLRWTTDGWPEATAHDATPPNLSLPASK